jgi:hypothetical protein
MQTKLEQPHRPYTVCSLSDLTNLRPDQAIHLDNPTSPNLPDNSRFLADTKDTIQIIIMRLLEQLQGSTGGGAPAGLLIDR